MTDPRVTPTSDLSVPAKSDVEIELIRIGQKLMIYAILFGVGIAILALFAPILVLLQFGVLALSILGLVKMFQGMHTPMWARVLQFISMLVPLVSLFVLLRLNSRATKVLRAAGYNVGLLGASARVA